MTFLALGTLYAAIGFTPWALGSEIPWALFVFRALGLAAFGVVAIGQWKGPFAHSVWVSRAAWCLLVLFAVSALSAAVSVHRGKSLEAMLNFLAICGLFLVAATLTRGARRLRSVALVQVLAAIPVAAVGLAQYFRPDLLPASNSYPGRALGPFGQPNRLGGYLIAILPVALALAFATQDRWLRAALFAGAVLLTMCLVVTFSRGAWLGLLVSLVLFSAAMFRWPALNPRAATLWIAAACLALPALFFLPSIFARIAPKPGAAAWNLPFDPEREGSGAMRRAIWSGALSAAETRPTLGSGIGTFREAFDRSKSDTMKRLEAEGTRTADNAHNQYLEVLVERGGLGLAAFLALAAVGLAAAVAAVSSAPAGAAASRWIALGLATGVVALLAHGVLDGNLSFVPHQTLLYADMGLLAAAAPGGTARRGRRSALRGAIGLVVAGTGLGVATASFAASGAAEEGARWMRADRPAPAAEAFRAAASLSPWNDIYAIDRAKAEEEVGTREMLPDRLRSAEASYRAAIRVNGSDPVTRQELARLYLAHPDVWGASGTNAARAELTAALSQNPYYAEIRNDLGVALLRSGDRAGAERAFHRASEGRREFVDPLLNLAALSLESGDTASAESWVRQALERAPRSDRARALASRLGILSGAGGSGL